MDIGNEGKRPETASAPSRLQTAKKVGRKTFGATLIGVGGAVLLPSAIVFLINLAIFWLLLKGTAGDYTSQYLWGGLSLVTGVVGLAIMGVGLGMWEGDLTAGHAAAVAPPTDAGDSSSAQRAPAMTPAMQEFMGRCIGRLKREGIAAKGSARFCILLGDDERELPLDKLYDPMGSSPEPVVAEAKRLLNDPAD